MIDRPEWLPEAVWPFELRTTAVDGLPIVYTDEGEGPVLLMVHDGLWSYVWCQLLRRLRNEYRVITLDFPGTGLTPAESAPVGLEADSRLLEAFVDALGLDRLTDRLTLVLHDLGGPVGAGLAARRPDLVAGLVLINTFAWPPRAKSLRWMLKAVSSRPVTAFGVWTNLIPRLTRTRFGVGRHLDRNARDAFLGPYRDRKRRRRFHILLGAPLRESAYLRAVEDALRTRLHERPALTIYGERNDPFGFQERLGEIFSRTEEMVVPGGNHFPMCDDPGGVAQRLRRWHRACILESPTPAP